MSSPKFVRKLKPKERKEIEGLIRQASDTRIMRRAQIIRLSSQWKKSKEIASIMGFSFPTVLRVINAFNEEGLASLPDKPRKGRPPKATERYIRCLKKAVAKSPIKLGYPFSSWTVSRLREHLARECDTLLHPDYLARLMAKHGIVYRRPRHIMGHLRDPEEYDEKKEIIKFLKKTRSTPKGTSTSSFSTNVKFISTRP